MTGPKADTLHWLEAVLTWTRTPDREGVETSHETNGGTTRRATPTTDTDARRRDAWSGHVPPVSARRLPSGVYRAANVLLPRNRKSNQYHRWNSYTMYLIVWDVLKYLLSFYLIFFSVDKIRSLYRIFTEFPSHKQRVFCTHSFTIYCNSYIIFVTHSLRIPEFLGILQRVARRGR